MKTLTCRMFASRLAGALLLALGFASSVPASDYPTTVLGFQPLAYWRFNETTASPGINTVANLGSAGAGVKGYALGGALTGEPGIVGHSVRFLNPGVPVASAPTRLDVPFDSSYNTAPPFSVEFWAKANSFGEDANGSCPLSSLDAYWFEGANRSGILFYVSGTGVYQFRVGGENGYSAVALSSVSVSAGAWTHVVGTFDGTNIILYVNGVEVGHSVSSSNPFAPNLFAPLRLGGTTLDGDSGPNWVTPVFKAILQPSGNRGFDGWVDEVAIYTNILAPATIASHYAGGSPNPNSYDALILASHPVLYLNLDETNYTPPDPSTYPVTANAGSLGASANAASQLGVLADQPGVPYAGFGPNNKCVYCSGEEGNVALLNSSAIPSLAGSPITLMAWVKLAPQSWSWEGDIIAQGISAPSSLGGSDGFAENFLRVGDPVDWEGLGNPETSYYEIGACPNASTSPAAAAIYPVPASDIGNWVFLVGTWDGQFWNLYHNGVLVAQTPDTVGPVPVLSVPSLLADGNAWSIGSRSGPDAYWGWWFGGYIDEPAIFGTALTADQIATLYNAAEVPPSIAIAPQVPPLPITPAGTLYEGYTVNFSVAAAGSPPLSYHWLKNGSTLSSTATNLLLNNVSVGDAGTYSVVVSNAFGAITSAVPLNVVASQPIIYSQPVSTARYSGLPFSFNVGAVGSLPITYQWRVGTTSVGASSPTYTNIASPFDAGTYSVTLNNAHGSITSSNAVFSVVTPTPNSYVTTILADQPLAYYRLGETSGTVAHDYAGGFDGTYFGSLLLGQPGYSLIDTNKAVGFGGQDNYVSVPSGISFSGSNVAFSLEAWANGGAMQTDNSAIITKGTADNGGSATEQFFIGFSGGNYLFFVRDPEGTQVAATADFGPDGAWHHLVGTYDSTNGLNFYIDGQVAANASPPARGIKSSEAAVSIGSERSGVAPVYDLGYSGVIDEVAIYNKALTSDEISAHYAAAYGPNSAPFVARQPASAISYAGLPVTLSVDAGGTVPLNYQWYQVGVGMVGGANSSSYTIPAAGQSDAGNYYVNVANSVNSVNSSNALVTILPPPTNPPVVPGLVVHLPLDGDLIDKTGRGNNGVRQGITVTGGVTNFGAGDTSFQPGPFAGHQALFYYTSGDDTNNLSFNFVTLGNRSDLQFGTTENFTVAYWIKMDEGYDGGDLPFFSNSTNSTGGFGYSFAPSYGVDGTISPSSANAWNGAWGVSLTDLLGNGVRYYGDYINTPINDGGWHFLVHVFDRSANLVTYLDGVQTLQYRQDGTTISAVGDLDSAAPANIGQGAAGTYRETGEGWIAELGVWDRALAPLEAASLYVAGVNSNFFYASSPLTFTASYNNALVLTFNGGVLQSSTNVAGGYLPVSATSPFIVPTTNTAEFFRVKF